MEPDTATRHRCRRQLHVFLFPFMSPGHQIPMLDIATLIASRGVQTSIVTTPLNLSRLRSALHRLAHLPITVHPLHFPSAAAGLPEHCESLDSLPSTLMSHSFSRAIMMLHPQGDDLVRQHQPDAIISDQNIPWTAQIARKYGIPRLVFHGTSCFSLCVSDSVSKYKPHENVNSDYKPFLVPGLPEPVHVTKSWMPSRFFRHVGLQEFFAQFVEAERNTYGTIANTFYEIEPKYVEHYGKISGKKIWPIGPVGSVEPDSLGMAERGNRASVNVDRCLSWLDSKEPNSVIYVCFGSLCTFAESQLVEIGLGLEASNCSFLWVIREGYGNGIAIGDLGERVKARGLVIMGWAPQALILNHPAVGGFMTHCGWNSVLEAVRSGVPMITWPLFAEQFYNAAFVLTRLRIGFGIGGDTGLEWGREQEAGVRVKRSRVAAAATRLMGGSESVREIRQRVRSLSELAGAAVSEGGSSHVNVDRLIDDLLMIKERLAAGQPVNEL
ncbi:scopoletin glucosyltransferase-like [Diospyros lotus]|uniref:scopoletin glucosyltransferase-like n=1 Tax=Diospyros lotus TaxID=55363 RepID=UPI0022547129|nr:scopoletin glucosyltransferase-like [Diospyros lotus]